MQFSFRLAFMIDLVYVGVGAFGGVALTRGALGTLSHDGAAAYSPCDSLPRAVGASTGSAATSMVPHDSLANTREK